MNRSSLFLLPENDDLLKQIQFIFDNFMKFGFFNAYGSCCFGMSALLVKLLASQGYESRIHGCYAKLQRGERNFLLGYKGYAKPNQIEGHAVCIVQDNVLVDFGLGCIRKTYSENFFHALACKAEFKSASIASLALDEQDAIYWCDDWQCPDMATVLSKQEKDVDILMDHYLQLLRN